MRLRRALPAFAVAALVLGGAPAGRSEETPGGPAKADASQTDASKAEAAAKGSAVVEQILRDREALITGKRFSYDPAGRRDPFRSLLEQVSRFKGPRPKGVRGMLIAEIDLVGVVKNPGGNVAFFHGSDNKGYFLRNGDQIYDGRIVSIDASAGIVTFRQQVDDPRLIKPYRDIVKRLTPSSEEEAQ